MTVGPQRKACEPDLRREEGTGSWRSRSLRLKPEVQAGAGWVEVEEQGKNILHRRNMFKSSRKWKESGARLS